MDGGIACIERKSDIGLAVEAYDGAFCQKGIRVWLDDVDAGMEQTDLLSRMIAWFDIQSFEGRSSVLRQDNTPMK